MNKNRIKILVTVPVDHLKQTCQILENIGEVIYVDHPSRESILSIVKDVDAIFPNTKMMLGKEIIDAAKKLKVICTPSTGTDHIDLKYCDKKEIDVLSLTKDFGILETITSTAEHAFAMMLNILRNIPWSSNPATLGEWDYTKFRGREAQGRIVGIIGYGRLGKMFSRFAKGFDMKVLAYDPYVTVSDNWVKQVNLDELLKRAEIITLHVHLNDETRFMVDKSWFNKMNGVYLINTSRGCLINEKDLIDALDSGRVKAAGLDVLCGEIEGDMGKHPLVKYVQTHSNLLITPHCGGMSFDGQEKAFSYAAAKLKKYFLSKL